MVVYFPFYKFCLILISFGLVDGGPWVETYNSIYIIMLRQANYYCTPGVEVIK